MGEWQMISIPKLVQSNHFQLLKPMQFSWKEL